MTLQRRLSGMERDLAAIQARISSLENEASAIEDEHPVEAAKIRDTIESITVNWDQLTQMVSETRNLGNRYVWEWVTDQSYRYWRWVEAAKIQRYQKLWK